MEPEGPLMASSTTRSMDEEEGRQLYVTATPPSSLGQQDPPPATASGGGWGEEPHTGIDGTIVQERNNKNQNQSFPYETGRVLHTKPEKDTLEYHQYSSVFWSTTHRTRCYYHKASQQEDDNSSLSSHSIPDLKKSYAFIESMSDSNEEEEEEEHEDTNENLWDTSTEEESSSVPVKMIHTIQWTNPSPMNGANLHTRNYFSRYNVLLGFLIGCFIQSSSLGANYVLTVLYGRDYEQLQEHHNTIMMVSFIWSLLTSSMGIFVILFVRSFLQQTIPHNATLEKTMTLWTMEYSFAFGALTGVCLAWFATDILLGFQAHAFHSLLTLFFAMSAKLLLSCTTSSHSNINNTLTTQDGELEHNEESFFSKDHKSLSEPLLVPVRISSLPSPPSPNLTWRRIHFQFKVYGITLGCLIGFFIQMSSLGASFLLDTFTGHVGPTSSTDNLESEGLMVFSLGWSFVFGTMGVLVLLVLRRLLTFVCTHVSERLTHKLGLLLEFYFAVGSLIGINLAWVLTYLGLGLHSHVSSSLLTLGTAIVWCHMLAYCFFSSCTLGMNQHDHDKEEYVVFVDTTSPTDEPMEAYEAVLLV
jgi:hypothetical protein